NGFFGAMSTVLMELIDTSGRFNVTLGDWFSSVQLGVGTIGLNDIDANQVDVSIGNNNTTVVITVLQTSDRFEPASENITINNPTVIPFGPKPSVLINGIWANPGGTGDGDENMTLRFGDNANPQLQTGW